MTNSYDRPPTGDGSARPADRCPRCGRALADYACLHCAADDGYGEAALVRRFISRPDLYSADASSRSWPDPSPDGWPAPEDRLPTQAPDPAVEQEPAVPAAHRQRFGAKPGVVSTARPRDLLDPTGWGPRGILTKAVITGGSIAIAAVVGIVGAVVAGPAPKGAAPSSATPAPQSGAVTGRVVQGLFCMDVSASSTGNGSPIRLGRCDTADGQRWTFAPDGTVRALGKCVRPVGGASAYGTKVELWDCDGTASQQWLHGPDGRLVHPASGACLEDPALAGAPGSRPQLAACADSPGQRWELR